MYRVPERRANVATYAAGTKSDNEVGGIDDRHRVQPRFSSSPPSGPKGAAPLLEVKHLSWLDRLRDISLTAEAGEVVGLGGLDGQGQRELLLALFGVLRGVWGRSSSEDRASLLRARMRRKKRRSAWPSFPGDHLGQRRRLPPSPSTPAWCKRTSSGPSLTSTPTARSLPLWRPGLALVAVKAFLRDHQPTSCRHVRPPSSNGSSKIRHRPAPSTTSVSLFSASLKMIRRGSGAAFCG